MGGIPISGRPWPAQIGTDDTSKWPKENYAEMAEPDVIDFVDGALVISEEHQFRFPCKKGGKVCAPTLQCQPTWFAKFWQCNHWKWERSTTDREWHCCAKHQSHSLQDGNQWQNLTVIAQQRHFTQKSSSDSIYSCWKNGRYDHLEKCPTPLDMQAQTKWKNEKAMSDGSYSRR